MQIEMHSNDAAAVIKEKLAERASSGIATPPLENVICYVEVERM
jgi:hypothetical protein